jgi:Rab proteins geranylgeranyltransferase component A
VKQYSHNGSSDSALLQVFGGAHSDILDSPQSGSKLSGSRAYSIALAPQLIYTDSKLLKFLVSSKVYRQLEFLAMGSWWIYSTDAEFAHAEDGLAHGKLIRVPTNREDVAFSDSSIDLRSKRLVMKVLRFIMEFEEHSDIWEPFRNKPFSELLSQHFKLSPLLVNLFLGLSLSANPPGETFTEIALPRIARHIRSIGGLGPGFSSIIPKWGGLSEAVQVACRAGAVGGAIYMLGTGIQSIHHDSSSKAEQNEEATVKLTNGDTVKAKTIVASIEDFPRSSLPLQPGPQLVDRSSCSIFIISSPLKSLFPLSAEGTPPPAGSVVIFPSGSIQSNSNPIYLVVHSSDTGDCPKNQCK